MAKNLKNSEVFTFDSDYRDYLKVALESSGKANRGIKGRLAEAIGCQSGFLSQVLGKQAHFNLEHGEKVNSFLGHSPEEAHFFLLLLQKTRAGTAGLVAYFGAQLEAIRQQRLVLKNRFVAESKLNEEDKSRYYSAWYYGAIRVLLTIPDLRRKERIAHRLKLPLAKVSEVLDFLESRGLARLEGDEYHPTDIKMHLGNDASMIFRHHGNWRTRALLSLDQESPADLHYSSVITVSRSDAIHLKEMIIKFLEEAKKVVRDSPAEEIFSLNLDLFLL